MPYIPNEEKVISNAFEGTCDDEGHQIKAPLVGNRELLDPVINELADRISQIHQAYGYDGAFLGLMNYTVTRLFCKIVLDNFDRPRYWMSPAIRGTCQDIGDELYRRVFVPYEDVQITKNGDVPEYLELLKRIK